MAINAECHLRQGVVAALATDLHFVCLEVCVLCPASIAFHYEPLDAMNFKTLD